MCVEAATAHRGRAAHTISYGRRGHVVAAAARARSRLRTLATIRSRRATSATMRGGRRPADTLRRRTPMSSQTRAVRRQQAASCANNERARWLRVSTRSADRQAHHVRFLKPRAECRARGGWCRLRSGSPVSPISTAMGAARRGTAFAKAPRACEVLHARIFRRSPQRACPAAHVSEREAQLLIPSSLHHANL